MQVVAWRQKMWDERAATKSGRAIAELQLPTVIYTALRNGSVDTIEDLIKYSPSDLAEMKGIGKDRLNQVIEALRSQGLKLAEEEKTKN